MLSVNMIDIAIITVENVDYHCIIHNNSKSEAFSLSKSSVLENIKNIVLNFSLFKTVSFYFICLVYIKLLIL